jgi:hypothetical protein
MSAWYPARVCCKADLVAAETPNCRVSPYRIRDKRDYLKGSTVCSPNCSNLTANIVDPQWAHHRN